MGASEDGIITFGHEFQLSVEKFEGKALNKIICLPPFAIVSHSSHMRVGPVLCPRGFFDPVFEEEIKGSFFGFRLLDKTIHEKKAGAIAVDAFIHRKNGGMKKLGSEFILSMNEWSTYIWSGTDLGKDIDELDANGFLFPDKTIRGKMRVEVPEELFRFGCCFPKYETRGHGESLDDVVSGRNHSYPDFVLKSSLDETELKCHRSVLGLASEYFRGVFDQENQPEVKRVNKEQADAACDELATLSQDSSPSTYYLKIEKGSTSLEFSGEVLEKVRQWMYKGVSSFKLGAVPASDVLAAADFLLLEDLKSFCEKQLILDVTDTNAWELLKLSDKFALKILKNRAMAVLVDSPGVLKQADEEEEWALKGRLSEFFQEVARANKIISFS